MIRDFNTLAEMSVSVADAVVQQSQVAIRERGRFCLALSGGETPRTLYSLLARDYRSKIDWNRVHLFWGDERYVPHDNPASNFRMAQETLLGKLNLLPDNIHPMSTSLPEPGESADSYAGELKTFFGTLDPAFDLILLGLGGDGHTASMFPSTPIEQTREGLVIVTTSPVEPTIRLSMTMNVLNHARNVFFLVSGAGKQAILQNVLADDGNPNSRYPSARVQPAGNLVWFVSKT